MIMPIRPSEPMTPGSRNDRPHPEYRLARPRRHALRAVLRDQLHLPGRWAAIQTGKYSHANGFLVNGKQVRRDPADLSQAPAQGRLHYGSRRKWHLGTHMSPQGYDYSEVLIGQGPYYNPPMRLDEDGDGKHDKVIKHIGYTTDAITDLALDWMKNKRDKDKPFMLMYQHKAPTATGSRPEVPDQVRRRHPARARHPLRRLQRPDWPPTSRT